MLAVNDGNDRFFTGSYSSLVVNPVSYRLVCGDCIDALKAIDKETVSLVLTDPPYNLGQFMRGRNVGLGRIRSNHFVGSGWDDQSYLQWVEMIGAFLNESFRILKEGGALLLFMSFLKVETVVKLAQDAGFYYKTTGVWHKTNPMPRNMDLSFVNSTEPWIYFVKGVRSGTFNNSGKIIHDFYQSPLAPQSEKESGSHPTQKPLELFSHFVNLLSNPQEVVLDPFMGSGTSALASLLNERRFVGIEKEVEYFELAKRRLLGSF